MVERNKRATPRQGVAHRSGPFTAGGGNSSHLNQASSSNQSRNHRNHYNNGPHQSAANHHRSPSTAMTTAPSAPPPNQSHHNYSAGRSFSLSSQPSVESPARSSHASSRSRHQRESSRSSSASNGCTKSICCSYLVAIISSFLVVLGIYLALTQFKASYLLISLAGLSIETIGACLYCMNNIRSSRQARIKQRLHTPVVTVVSNPTHIPPNGRLRTSNGTRFSCQQITNESINLRSELSNVGNVNNSQTNNDSHNCDAEPAINEPTTIGSLQVQECVSADRIQQIDEIHDTPSSNNNLVANINELAHPESDNILESIASAPPCDQADFVSTGDTSVLILDQGISQPLTNKIETLSNSPNTHSNGFIGPQSNVRSNIGQEENPHIQSDPATSSLVVVDMSLPLSSEPSLSPSSSSPVHLKAISETDQNSSDLRNKPNRISGHSSLVPTDPQLEARRKQRSTSRQQHPKPNNWRRTVVMGPSGEEEVIEIDEEDLDNMSILPPSYDSIATGSVPTTSVASASDAAKTAAAASSAADEPIQTPPHDQPESNN